MIQGKNYVQWHNILAFGGSITNYVQKLNLKTDDLVITQGSKEDMIHRMDIG